MLLIFSMLSIGGIGQKSVQHPLLDSLISQYGKAAQYRQKNDSVFIFTRHDQDSVKCTEYEIMIKQYTDTIYVYNAETGMQEMKAIPYRKPVKHGAFIRKNCRTAQKLETINYRNGLKTGEWKIWYKNGILKYMAHYDKKGRQTGIYRAYYPHGKIKWEGQYKIVLLKCKDYYYENGVQFRYITRKISKKTGVWKHYDKYGNLIETITYKQYFNE